MSRDQDKSVQRRIFELQVEHRDLDDIVARLAGSPNIDQLLVTRLKKRKLQLKDQITKLKSALIPDLNA